LLRTVVDQSKRPIKNSTRQPRQLDAHVRARRPCDIAFFLFHSAKLRTTGMHSLVEVGIQYRTSFAVSSKSAPETASGKLNGNPNSVGCNVASQRAFPTNSRLAPISNPKLSVIFMRATSEINLTLHPMSFRDSLFADLSRVSFFDTAMRKGALA